MIKSYNKDAPNQLKIGSRVRHIRDFDSIGIITEYEQNQGYFQEPGDFDLVKVRWDDYLEGDQDDLCYANKLILVEE